MLNNKQLHANKVLQHLNEDLLKYIEWLTNNRDKDDKLYVKSLSTITVLEMHADNLKNELNMTLGFLHDTQSTITVLERNNQEFNTELEITHQICTDLETAGVDLIEQNKELRAELITCQRALRMARGELEALRKRTAGTFGAKL